MRLFWLGSTQAHHLVLVGDRSMSVGGLVPSLLWVSTSDASGLDGSVSGGDDVSCGEIFRLDVFRHFPPHSAKMDISPVWCVWQCTVNSDSAMDSFSYHQKNMPVVGVSLDRLAKITQRWRWEGVLKKIGRGKIGVRRNKIPHTCVFCPSRP